MARPIATAHELDHPPLTQKLTWILSFSCALAIGNIYYNQPLLAQMGHALQSAPEKTAGVAVLTQLGYALGLFFIVPLGDKLERRRIVLRLLILLSIVLAATALSPNVTTLLALSLVIGMANVISPLLIAFAASLAAPNERGKVVGTLMSGLLIGILLARTIAGFIGSLFGWRAMYFIAAALMLFLYGLLRANLPTSKPRFSGTYLELLKSLVVLVKNEPVLVEASLASGLTFGAFSALWSVLSFKLETPPFHFDSTVVGLFGLLGVVGALGAPFIGRISDRGGPVATAAVGTLIVILSFGIFIVATDAMSGLVVGVVLMDLGVQVTHVANQTRVLGINPAATSRLNTVYMCSYFFGGAAGSALAGTLWPIWGWLGSSMIGLVMAAVALVIILKGARDRAMRVRAFAGKMTQREQMCSDWDAQGECVGERLQARAIQPGPVQSAHRARVHEPLGSEGSPDAGDRDNVVP